MNKIVHLTDMSLLCDACGHTMLVADHGPHLIGTPCPECGADMLTQQDYDDGVRLLEQIEQINSLFGFLGSETPSEDASVVGLNPHDGALNIRIEP